METETHQKTPPEKHFTPPHSTSMAKMYLTPPKKGEISKHEFLQGKAALCRMVSSLEGRFFHMFSGQWWIKHGTFEAGLASYASYPNAGKFGYQQLSTAIFGKSDYDLFQKKFNDIFRIDIASVEASNFVKALNRWKKNYFIKYQLNATPSEIEKDAIKIVPEGEHDFFNLVIEASDRVQVPWAKYEDPRCY